MKRNKNIIITGSLVYDRIMDFPGNFSEHILPEKVHILNVSFTINRLKESFGGTAGNIAYNLALLGERPKILGVVGGDFDKYGRWLKKNKVDISLVKKVPNETTASAYIITDKSDNQITGFYPGPRDRDCCREVNKIKKIDLAIISPELKERMLDYAKIYKKIKVPYIFDPGQQITSFSANDLKSAINGAEVLIGNDYEIELIAKRTNLNLEKLQKLVNILVITKGDKGSEIYHNNKKIKIPPAKPKKILDPTGAGDAYRAGLIKGLIEGWPLGKIGRFAGVVAVHAVEQYGTQAHRFTWRELEKRYWDNFRESI